jgi:hypothetical protein
MRMLVALLASVLLLCATAHAEDIGECAVSEELIPTDRPLPHVVEAIAAKRLSIAVIGTASSTLRAPENAYPAQLAAELKRRLPGVAIELKTHIEPSGTTAEMAETFPKLLAEDKPALVVWQTGTADLMLGNDADSFRDSLEKGIAALQAGGADVIVVNLQYSPRTDPMTDAAGFANVMRMVAEDRAVPLFDRMGIMKYWNDEGTFDFYSTTNDGTTNRVHACFGRLLADLLIGSAKPGEAKAGR